MRLVCFSLHRVAGSCPKEPSSSLYYKLLFQASDSFQRFIFSTFFFLKLVLLSDCDVPVLRYFFLSLSNLQPGGKTDLSKYPIDMSPQLYTRKQSPM